MTFRLLSNRQWNSTNSAVYNENQKNEGDGLTTLVVAVIYNERCFVGNVGDSRAYWIQSNLKKSGKAGKLLQLTRDHTYYNIYGGDKNSDDAGIVVNAIGKKQKVQVDIGFYLKGDDIEQAQQLGLVGLPLKPGDTILLCSDGLIKSSLQGEPYTKPEEIIDSVQTKSMPDRAAIKMVSRAEGRRPDDNVSAVTIQYLSRELIAEMNSRSQKAQTTRVITRIALVLIGLFAISLIGFLGYQLSPQKKELVYVPTDTPAPTFTPTKQVPPGKAELQQVNGTGANINGISADQGIDIEPGSKVFASSDGMKIVVGGQSGPLGITYWFGGSAGKMDFDGRTVKPALENGAIYIQPVTGSAEIHFSQWPDITASVTGSRMIVELKGNDIWTYCFEGKCLLDLGAGKDPKKIDVGSKRVYRTTLDKAEDPIVMTYNEMWDWNVKCNFCMFGLLSTPTPTPQPQFQPGPSSTPKPKPKPKPTTYGAGFAWDDRFADMETQRAELAVQLQLPLSLLFTIVGMVLVVSPKNILRTFNSIFLLLLAVVFRSNG